MLKEFKHYQRKKLVTIRGSDVNTPAQKWGQLELGKIFPYRILSIFSLHVQLNLPKKQCNSIQDFVNRLNKSLLANSSAWAMRWPRFSDSSSFKAFVSVTRPHHKGRDKALKKTDRANAAFLSLLFLQGHPCLPGILPAFFQYENNSPVSSIWIRHIS